jgi:predicted amidohydrolase
MTRNSNLKRRIRGRAAKTGESYTAARRHLVNAPDSGIRPRMILAVAQLPLNPDPGDVGQLRRSGDIIRTLMREARAEGAHLVHFPEGALTSPHKRVMSSTGPQVIGPAGWGRANWDALGRELDQIARLAGRLRIWAVVGGIHHAAGDDRPRNCAYVVSDRGEVAGRYDERMLSRTKATLMYAPGRDPLVFTARGVRFGCALGMETHYAELFSAYEELGVDCVLFSTAGNRETPGVFAVEAAGHAAANSIWISYAGPAQDGHPPAGVVRPDGTWACQCDTRTSELVAAELQAGVGAHARAWRRISRALTSSPLGG